MLRWALIFLLVALIAGALGLWGVSAIFQDLAWIFFIIFLILFVISLVAHLIRGRGV